MKWLKKRHGFSDEAALEEVSHCHTDAVARCLSLEPMVCENGLPILVLRNGAVVETMLYHRSQLMPIKTVPQKKRSELAVSIRPEITEKAREVNEELPRDNGWIDSR